MTPKRAFLYAHPAGHSLSPEMHNAGFKHIGLNAVYQAVDIEPSCLAKALKRLREPEVLGANLSLPHKEAVIPMLDDISETARAIGAVNTIVQNSGKLYGTNTDAQGFYQSLGYTPQGTALILGAGGAARAAVYALAQAGLNIWLYNRTPQRAFQLLDSMGISGKVFAAQEHIPFDQVNLLINSSSVGLNNPSESPLHGIFPVLAPEAAVCDMVYKPLHTKLLSDAADSGYRTITGIGMLTEQAHLAFQLWTGSTLPSGLMLQAIQHRLQP